MVIITKQFTDQMSSVVAYFYPGGRGFSIHLKKKPMGLQRKIYTMTVNAGGTRCEIIGRKHREKISTKIVWKDFHLSWVHQE